MFKGLFANYRSLPLLLRLVGHNEKLKLLSKFYYADDFVTGKPDSKLNVKIMA